MIIFVVMRDIACKTTSPGSQMWVLLHSDSRHEKTVHVANVIMAIKWMNFFIHQFIKKKSPFHLFNKLLKVPVAFLPFPSAQRVQCVLSSLNPAKWRSQVSARVFNNRIKIGITNQPTNGRFAWFPPFSHPHTDARSKMVTFFSQKKTSDGICWYLSHAKVMCTQ